MTGHDVDQLHADRREMVDILCKYWLLLELSNEAIVGNIEEPDLGSLIVEQINRIEQSSTYRDHANAAVKNIRRLGDLPDKREQAMKLLLEAVEVFRFANDKYNCDLESAIFEYGHDGKEEMLSMNILMCDVIRAHYGACQASRMDRYPLKFMREFKARGSLYYDGEFPDETPRYVRNPLDEARDLLDLVCGRTAATTLANTVAGDILPPELVNMIRDYICSDEDLRAVD